MSFLIVSEHKRACPMKDITAREIYLAAGTLIISVIIWIAAFIHFDLIFEPSLKSIGTDVTAQSIVLEFHQKIRNDWESIVTLGCLFWVTLPLMIGHVYCMEKFYSQLLQNYPAFAFLYSYAWIAQTIITCVTVSPYMIIAAYYPWDIKGSAGDNKIYAYYLQLYMIEYITVMGNAVCIAAACTASMPWLVLYWISTRKARHFSEAFKAVVLPFNIGHHKLVQMILILIVLGVSFCAISTMFDFANDGWFSLYSASKLLYTLVFVCYILFACWLIWIGRHIDSLFVEIRDNINEYSPLSPNSAAIAIDDDDDDDEEEYDFYEELAGMEELTPVRMKDQFQWGLLDGFRSFMSSVRIMFLCLIVTQLGLRMDYLFHAKYMKAHFAYFGLLFAIVVTGFVCVIISVLEYDAVTTQTAGITYGFSYLAFYGFLNVYFFSDLYLNALDEFGKEICVHTFELYYVCAYMFQLVALILINNATKNAEFYDDIATPIFGGICIAVGVIAQCIGAFKVGFNNYYYFDMVMQTPNATFVNAALWRYFIGYAKYYGLALVFKSWVGLVCALLCHCGIAVFYIINVRPQARMLYLEKLKSYQQRILRDQ